MLLNKQGNGSSNNKRCLSGDLEACSFDKGVILGKKRNFEVCEEDEEDTVSSICSQK